MTKYVPVTKTYAPPEARVFIEEVIKVCRRHGFVLWFEGTPFSGNFIISPYSPKITDRLRNALVEVTEVNNE